MHRLSPFGTPSTVEVLRRPLRRDVGELQGEGALPTDWVTPQQRHGRVSTLPVSRETPRVPSRYTSRSDRDGLRGARTRSPPESSYARKGSSERLADGQRCMAWNGMMVVMTDN